MFTDGAVLQHGRPVTVWGTSNQADGTEVTVSYGDKSAKTTVSGGEWEATLPALDVSKEGKTLSAVSGTNVKTFEDVVVGDVYFAAGQSNAEMPFSYTDTYSVDNDAMAEDTNIRFFYQARSDAFLLSANRLTTPQKNPINANYRWEKAKKGKTDKLSAVGYYFADAINAATNKEIPIGIIQTAFGGATLAELSPKSVNDKYCLEVETNRVKYNAYNTLVAPTEKYTARGMLWYQGESDSWDSNLAQTYPDRFNDMVAYFRNIQGNDFPVFYVQLSSHADYKDNGSGEGWTFDWRTARFRQQQNLCEDKTEDVFMTVSHDWGLTAGEKGDTAHPKYKKPIGQRIAAIALERIYGDGTNINSKLSPKVKSIKYDALGATIVFERVNGGLKTDGENVLGFELIKDGKATAANAVLVKTNGITDTVRVTGVDNPTGVRYAYYNAVAPTMATLKGGNDLPCPTFSENGFNVEPLSLGAQRQAN